MYCLPFVLNSPNHPRQLRRYLDSFRTFHTFSLLSPFEILKRFFSSFFAGMKGSIFLLILIWTSLTSSSSSLLQNTCDYVYTLRPGKELRNLDGKIPGDIYARIEGLEDDVSYEFVLSYPASRPAKYILGIVDHVPDVVRDCIEDDREMKQRKRTVRTLLDTEKMRLEGSTNTYVHVKIFPSIVRSEFEELNVATFNLRVEKLVLGVIPLRAMSLIAFCLVGLVFILFFVTPLVVQFLLSSTAEFKNVFLKEN